MQIPASLPWPSVASAAPAAVRFGRMLAALAGLASLWWLERRTARELDQLDSAMLRDIGMTRWQMHRQMQAERETLFRRLRQAGV